MAAPALHLQPRHWLYLDEHRTHELHVQVNVEGDRASLVTTEFPAGSRDPAEVVQTNAPIHGERELVELLAEVEDRLAMSGRYFRADAREMKWSALPPARNRGVDLRAHEASLPAAPGAKLRFHHFHGQEAVDRLLIDMPRADADKRHILAAMDFTFPFVDQGSLEILHTRLTPQTLQSAVIREHIEAPRRGFQKLFEPRDYERAYGDGWFEKTKIMLTRAAARLVGGPAPVPEAPYRPVGPPGELERIRAALGSGRIGEIRDRFVDRVTRERLIAGGEHAIRRHVNALRRTYSHAVAYDLSLLEAALLVEYALPAQMWDLAGEEGAKLLRYLHGYG